MAEETKQATETEVDIPHTPGQVISPSANSPTPIPATTPYGTVQPPEPPQLTNSSQAPAPLPVAPITPPTSASGSDVAPTPTEAPQPVAQEQDIAPVIDAEPQRGLFRADDEMIDQKPQQTIEPVSWTASEFIDHEKSVGWYMALTGVALASAVAVYLITKDMISAVVVILAALTLGFYGARKPKQVQYRLDTSGLTIGNKLFRYAEFKSFSVATEGAFSSIVFMPMKRFAPLTTIYLAPENEKEIVNILNATLPFEEHKKDAVDKLMHKIRF